MSSDVIDEGYKLYSNHCSVCHGAAAASSHSIPDLRNLPMVFYDNFEDVVRGGMMEGAGMPNFAAVLSEEEVKAVYAYVIYEAHALREEQEPSIFDPVIHWFYELLADILVWTQRG